MMFASLIISCIRFILEYLKYTVNITDIVSVKLHSSSSDTNRSNIMCVISHHVRHTYSVLYFRIFLVSTSCMGFKNNSLFYHLENTCSCAFHDLIQNWNFNHLPCDSLSFKKLSHRFSVARDNLGHYPSLPFLFFSFNYHFFLYRTGILTIYHVAPFPKKKLMPFFHC